MILFKKYLVIIVNKVVFKIYWFVRETFMKINIKEYISIGREGIKSLDSLFLFFIIGTIKFISERENNATVSRKL